MNLHTEIIEIAREIQTLVDNEFIKLTRDERIVGGLDQCGLKDGATIVIEYVESGEFGIAMEHLKYMIEEADLFLATNLRDRMLNLQQILK